MTMTASKTMTDIRLSAPRVKAFSAAAFLVVLFFGTGPGSASAATLEPSSYDSTEGYFQLTWEAEQPVRLVESTRPDFGTSRIVYTGSDSGHVASGKPDGVWYYRLESEDGESILSDVATITVRHHTLERAILFFVLGAIVFVATLGLIFVYNGPSDERG